MTTLRVIVDEMLSGAPGGVSRYTEELTRALISTAPKGVAVEGLVSASTETEYERIHERLPGLATLHKSALQRRELSSAWQHGFTRLPGNGMVHAPSLFAPLAKHDRLNEGDQIIVTLHDTLAWTAPQALNPRRVSWHKAMLKRAERYADAIVVPSHTVADELMAIAAVGDRIRVIGGAPSSALRVPSDADLLATELQLPDRYVLAIGDVGAQNGIVQLVTALAALDNDVELLIAGTEPDTAALGTAASEANVEPTRVRGLGALTDPALAVALSRAAVFAYPNVEEGFGLPVLDAFALGTPVVHSDAPALIELGADAGLAVEREGEGHSERLAEAIASVLADPTLAERLRVEGIDRAGVFTWRGAADKVWQLHADL
jgi:glycosyltransferase involved in cell wall biosynthesis